MNSDDIHQRGVLFVTRKWPPAVGGMETYSVELTAELERRVPLQVMALPGRADGGPPGTFPMLCFGVSTVRRYLNRKIPPAVLHVGDMACWPLALLAFARRPRAAIVLSAHGTDVSFPRRKTLKGRVYGAYLRLGAKLLSGARVIANSAATARAASESGWHCCAIIPLATRILGEGLPNGHSRDLLFAGRLIKQKGLGWFVPNVLPLLPEEIGLRVAGTVWDTAERTALDHPRVSYLGPLDKRTLIDEYRRALCVIVPNIEPPSGEFEGFGLVALEASAAGALVLASATGGLTEAVINGETGFLLETANVQAWADKITEVASWSGERRDKFLTNAWMRGRELFSWSRVAEEVIKVYDAAFTGR